MKYYFILIDGIHINGYTETRFEDEEGKLLSSYIEIENPSQDLLDNFIFYKTVEGELVKMSDEEFKALYPNYGVVIPSDIELTNQRTTDLELDGLETNQRITDLELFILEGGK